MILFFIMDICPLISAGFDPRQRAAGSGEALPAGGVIARCTLLRRTEEITRRKWLKRKIRYPIGAHFLRVSRILHLILAARLAGGAGGSDVTRW